MPKISETHCSMVGRASMSKGRARSIVICWGIALIFALGGSSIDARAAEPRRPNIIVILADDMGYHDVGFQGCQDIPTPRIDSLAQAGVRCTNGYVSGPYCSPTRAGLLTGRYQQRFGHEFNPGGRAEQPRELGLPLTETTIADRLRTAGYATGLVGKWHLGGAPKFHPQKRGFDEFYGFLGGAHAYFPGMGEPIYRGAEVASEKEYLTDAWGREAVEFIRRHKAGPFFLYLAFNAVHTPMQATDERLAQFASISDTTRRTYDAMLLAMEQSIGKVLDELARSQLEDNTLIFFFSDNGGATMQGTTINGSVNTPLRGSKRTTLEGGIRVPFVVQWKGKLPAGAVYEQPVIQLDVLPTALAAAGIEIQQDWNLDGVNLLPYLKGDEKRPPHETLYWRMGEQMALRRGDWKIVRYDPVADDKPPRTPMPIKLYNLAEDIGESRDLAAEQPDRVKELEAIWQTWSKQMAAPLWGPQRVAAR